METRNCQNCRKDFVITQNDFGFYEKIKVQPPTFCPWCRFIRRMMWRNERVLYKRNCDLCHKNIISTYPADSAFTVYCKDCWYSDQWDAVSYGRDYDFSKSFFEQYHELMKKVPRFALWQRNVINSEYANMTAESRNVYLSASIVGGSENIFYCKSADSCFNAMDSYSIKNSEDSYENIYGEKNYNCQHILMSRNCIDSYFLVDCVNCSNCFMSSNLRNKKYFFRNKQYNQQEYFQILDSLKLGKRGVRKELLKEFDELRNTAIYRYANIINSPHSTGNNLSNMKNGTQCFDCYSGEDFKYCYRNFTSKDCMDCDFSQISELMYEYVTGGLSDYGVRFSYSALDQLKNVDYTDSCRNGSNLFGCISLYNKSNVILNKVYSKEEFNSLREKIIKQMEEIPYIDAGGRVYRYGEFFSHELSPYAYNETLANEFEPLSKAEANNMHFSFKDIEIKNSDITMKIEDIPDNIAEVSDNIQKEILACSDEGKCKHQCFYAFRITKGELGFYRKHNIPLPDKCTNCRYFERFAQVPLPKLYKRICDKCRKVEFETPYSPDRPEKVYCEKCYQQEVY